MSLTPEIDPTCLFKSVKKNFLLQVDEVNIKDVTIEFSIAKNLSLIIKNITYSIYILTLGLVF